MDPRSVAPDEISLLKDNKYDFIILGADGQQGRITSRYLHNKGYRIVCVDLYIDGIKEIFKNTQVPIIRCNCTDILELKTLLVEYRSKVLLNLTYQQSTSMVKACIDHDVHFLDIFANYDWVDNYNQNNYLDGLNGRKTVIVTGCGCAPGITSLMAKKIGCDFKEIETIEAGFCWDSNVPEFVPPFCISDAAYELFYDAWVIISKAYKSIEPLSYSKEYDFPLIGRKKVYAISHIELFSFLDYFQDKNIQNVFFYGGFPEHCIEVLKCLDKLNLIKQRNNVIKIPDQQGKTHSFTNQDIITAISKRIETPKNYTETEIVWSTIIGKDFNNKEMVKTMLCKVPPIEGWEQHGCNVDTGVPAGVIAEIILKDKVLPGVYMPEGAIDPDPFIKELEDFGFEFIIQDSFL